MKNLYQLDCESYEGFRAEEVVWVFKDFLVQYAKDNKYMKMDRSKWWRVCCTGDKATFLRVWHEKGELTCIYYVINTMLDDLLAAVSSPKKWSWFHLLRGGPLLFIWVQGEGECFVPTAGLSEAVWEDSWWCGCVRPCLLTGMCSS